ncbi:membrane protein [Corynebacterium sphenisci DSM 44792]|uniref:Membrane protein n=1 Tax=Corynebacterium sphenisci DSM 44792 TaxID=1437874 RepID=A0A1L7CYI1_9CORY|nr:DUF368 domain-containing protein [Corynebacterium sphenisci]APT90877.1 membrane protein [Corynebacterium sphenisci DSM 44792]
MNTNDTAPDAARAPVTPDGGPPFPAPTPAAAVANIARGALIGIAESIPGVSGGTLALITGIYERLISSATAITRLPRAIARGEAAAALRRIDWWLLLPVGLGMVAMVFSVAGTMESFVTDHPTASRALFSGMIAASIAIPLQEIRPGELDRPGLRARAAVVFALFALGLFALTSMPKAAAHEPGLVAVFAAAAVAVCALVLPGVSGSFFLLVVGLYAPTMGAVADRDLGYLAVFALGALTGIVAFVRFLEWMLARHHGLTLAAMAGLLLGSLRALWPWQAVDGAMRAPGADWPAALALFALGAAVVAVVAWAQRRFTGAAHAG